MREIIYIFAVFCFFMGCSDKKEEELTIVVREDTQRIEDEKNRLTQERKKVEESRKDLEVLEKKIGEMASSAGSNGDNDSAVRLKAMLANFRSMQAEQKRYYERREKELSRRAADLDRERDNLTSSAKPAAPAAPSAGNAPNYSSELAEIRSGQEGLRKEMSSLRQSLGSIDGQLRLLAERLGKTPAAPAAVAPAATLESGKVVKRKRAEKVYKQVQNQMRKKGLLVADLPSSVQPHNAAIRRALADGDYSLAFEYSNQLKAAIKIMKIDRSFINAKMGRLTAMKNSNPPKGATQTEVDRRFRRVTQMFTDGKYAQANNEINQIRRVIMKQK